MYYYYNTKLDRWSSPPLPLCAPCSAVANRSCAFLRNVRSWFEFRFRQPRLTTTNRRYSCTNGLLIDLPLPIFPLFNRGEPIVRLPPKRTKLVRIPFSPAEADYYSALHSRSKTQFDAYVAEGKLLSNYAGVLELLLRYVHVYVAHTSILNIYRVNSYS